MSAANRPFNIPEPGGYWARPEDSLARRTAAVERIVRDAFERHVAPLAPQGLALLAAGGFGRRELFPQSDVDLLVLTEKQNVSEPLRGAIAAFLQELWDSGLRASHSVHTPGDCAELHEQNIELNIALLDERFLAGDRGLDAKLSVAMARFLHGQASALARHLCRMARERHAKFGGSIYQLEPNIKESPGGLRDYQLVKWMHTLYEAQRDRPSHTEGAPELLAARDFLCGLRCHLHERAGRDSNTLTFDLQDEIADLFSTTPAEWMQRYYSQARDVSRAAMRAIETADEQASSLLVQFRDWRSRVANSEFHVSRERVYIRAPHRLEFDPALALRLFEFVGRHGMRLALETVRRVDQHAGLLQRAFREPAAPLWPALKSILATPHAALALRAMHETGTLAAVFPEWERVECLVIRDFYHRYTVDEHTLRAIEILQSFRAPTDPALQQFAGLFSEMDRPDLVAFALLFHDLGKAAPEETHVAPSMRLAAQAMERIGMPEDDRRAVLALIERHLDLSSVINSRDLDDPRTAVFVAGRAETLEFLKQLALLTYCDIGAVNPSAMTPWRMDQLWRVYLLGYNELTRELETERIREGGGLEAPGAEEFLEGFPVRYLHTHTPAEVAEHFRLEQSGRERGVAVQIRKENGFYRLTLVAHDRPALLASIAGALSGFGMNILKAEGFANRHGIILDTFVFEDPHRSLDLNPTEVDRLRLTLERVTLGKLEVKELLRGRPAPVAPSKHARIAPTVSFDSQASGTATLIEVVAEDRPGLLYALASAISSTGANISVVLIDTQAHKAIDVFYVTAAGKKLTPARQADLKEKLLEVCAR